MNVSVKEIADFLGGEVVGDPGVMVTDISKIESGNKGSISFLSNPKYVKYLESTCVSAVIVGQNMVNGHSVNPALTLIKVKEPYESLSKLLKKYYSKTDSRTGIAKEAVVGVNVKIGENVFIAPNVCISDDCVIGDNVRVYPNSYIGHRTNIGNNSVINAGVKIYDNCRIGNNCTIHSNAVIGSDGFGFSQNSGNNEKVPQVGNVVIKDNVEIGSCTTIDRATIGSTIINEFVKLDNQIQIGHNVEIGKGTVIAAQTGIAGSTKIGKNCMIGGQVGMVGHIVIEDNVKIGAKSGISKSLKEGSIVQGHPATEMKQFHKTLVIFRKLPELLKRIEKIDKVLFSNNNVNE